MKLVMTLLIRDEADILASNIEFHLSRGVDFIIATDNLSVDGSTAILHDYERRSVLHYIYEPDDDYSQYRWVTRMARLAATEFGADWVINNDADEFWWPEHGDLKQALAAVPPSYEAAVVQRTNFLPRPMADGIFFADAMTVRWQKSLNTLGQPLPPKTCHRGFPDIDVAQGNHSATRDGRSITTTAAPITILHFPMRRYEQFSNKIAKGGSAVRRNSIPGLVPTWLQLHDVYAAGDLEKTYRSSLPDDAGIEAGLRDGTFVRDERLKECLAQLKSQIST
jgi:Glycosyl transferase family 2